MALIDLVAGQSEQAIAGLDRVLAANPGDVRALVDKAIALGSPRQSRSGASDLPAGLGQESQRSCHEE